MRLHSSGKPFWTAEEQVAAIAAANAGEAAGVIGARLGRSAQAVRNVLYMARRAGVSVRHQKRGRKPVGIDAVEVVRLRGTGLGAYQVAAAVGVSLSTVYRILREHAEAPR